jgi:zinc resistance-associated protein
MKKVAIIGGLILIMALTALPVLAKGPGGGYGGNGGGYCGDTSANLTEEQSKALQESRQKFLAETQDLRDQIQLKRAELQALMLNKETKQADLLAKNKELRALTNQMSEKGLLFKLELRKQFPQLSSGYGRGAGCGFGSGGGSNRGSGQGRRGGSGGGCWQ